MRDCTKYIGVRRGAYVVSLGTIGKWSINSDSTDRIRIVYKYWMYSDLGVQCIDRFAYGVLGCDL